MKQYFYYLRVHSIPITAGPHVTIEVVKPKGFPHSSNVEADGGQSKERNKGGFAGVVFARYVELPVQ